MLDEIRQQPAALERTLKSEWRHAKKLRQHFETQAGDFVIIAARGTSDNAAQFARYLVEITTGIPVSLAAPSISTLYRSRSEAARIARWSRSHNRANRRTPTSFWNRRKRRALLRSASRTRAKARSPLAEHAFLVRAGKEKSVAATKTYTGQLLCSICWRMRSGRRSTESLQKLAEWTAAALTLEAEIRAAGGTLPLHAARSLRRPRLNYSNSLEFALKLMETCYVVAERFSSADLLHGPIAMLEPSFPAFVFCPPGVTWNPMAELLDKLYSIGAETLLITDRSNKAARDTRGQTGRTARPFPSHWLREAGSRKRCTHRFPTSFPHRLFAASLAEVKHLDPDRPRTLNKVTQTL